MIEVTQHRSVIGGDIMKWLGVAALVFLSVLVGIGRFFIPGHDLSWPGTYESMSHIWVGVLLCLSFQKNRLAIAAVVLLSILEVVMFMLR